MAREATVCRAVRSILGVALLLLASGVACRAPFRLPVEPHDVLLGTDALLLEAMNPFLLTNAVSNRVVVEVDRVAGLTPNPDALEALRETLLRYAPPGKQVEVRMDDEIPLDDWHSTPGGFLDRAQQLGPWVDGPRDEDSELIYVVYVPDEPEYMGWATRLVLERDGEPQPVDTILMFPATIKRGAELWITAKKVERAILIHELGHLLGLVSGPGHREKGNPRHCTEPQCVMTHPSARSKTYNALPALFAGKIPHEYCNRCRDDITNVQELWRQAALEPGFADRLREQRRIETLRAQACWYGQQRRFADAAAALRKARTLSGEEPTPTQEGTIELLELCPAGED